MEDYIENLGGYAATSRILGVSPQAVFSAVKRGYFPKKWRKPLEDAIGEVLPDDFFINKNKKFKSELSKFIHDLGGRSYVASELGLVRASVDSWVTYDSVPIKWRIPLGHIALEKGVDAPFDILSLKE